MRLGAPLHKEVAIDGQRIVAAEGRIDAEAAWKIVKWLEDLGQEEFPLVLDLSQVRSIHWLAVEILEKGVQYMNCRGRSVRMRCAPGATRQRQS